MSKQKNYKGLIKAVAKECGYEVNENEASFEVYTDFEHPVSFWVKENSEGYLQVHIWEDSNKKEKEHKYGKARYSLRTALDVVNFCSILSYSYLLRARRTDE